MMYWMWTFIILSVLYREIGACPEKCNCTTTPKCTGTYVNCRFKGLTTVPTIIPKDTCYLYLGSNRMTTIKSGSFEGLSNLQTLLLWSNQLTTIGKDSFKGLWNLTVLDLDDNRIRKITNGTFEGLTNLQGVRLNYNRITTIENGAFKGLTNLQTVDLSVNRITTIENGAFEGLTNLQTVTIDRNPLQCDCQLVPFLAFAKSRTLSLRFYDEPKCQTPGYLKGTLLKDLPLQQMILNCRMDSTKITPGNPDTTITTTENPDTTTITTEKPETGMISTAVMNPAFDVTGMSSKLKGSAWIPDVRVRWRILTVTFYGGLDSNLNFI